MKTTPNSNIKRFMIAASIALAIPLSAAAFGGSKDSCGMEGHGMRGHAAMGGKMMPHLRGLNLTEVQQDKVFEIMHNQAPIMRDKAKALHKAEADLRQLTAGEDYSEAKAQALADTAAKAMSEMALARAKAERQVFELLTPEQRKLQAEMKPDDFRRGDGDGPRGRGREGRSRG